MKAIRQILSFEGRASRAEWWWVIIALGFIVYLSLLLLSIGIADLFALRLPKSDWRLLFNLVLLWPWLAVGARRCHDRGQSGWWTLLQLVPVIGFFWAIINLGLLPGTDGPNKYGPSTGNRPESVEP